MMREIRSWRESPDAWQGPAFADQLVPDVPHNVVPEQDMCRSNRIRVCVGIDVGSELDLSRKVV
jgi:hypothetical protein